MDVSALDHLVTEEERASFEREGYLVLPDVLPGDLVDRLSQRAVEIFEREVGTGHAADDPLIHHPVVFEGQPFLDLLTWPTTFPKMWGLLSPNIWLYHSHLIVTPPHDQQKRYPTRSWHQDSGGVNREMAEAGSPRPRLSAKLAFFLTDCSVPGRGNLGVVPGSHVVDELERPTDGGPPRGAVEVLAEPGDAVIFDRRTWHAAWPNLSDSTRKVLTYGYGYRWIQKKDDTDLRPLWNQVDPITGQLLGVGTNQSRYGPTPENLPLLAWLEEHDALPGTQEPQR